MTTYRAETEKGRGLTLGPRIRMVHGWYGFVKLGDRQLTRHGLFKNQAAAMKWATQAAKRYRDYRQQHGEGLEEIADKKRAAEQAAVARSRRMENRKREMYDLIVGLVSDLELASDVPAQAQARIEKAKAVIRFIDEAVPIT